MSALLQRSTRGLLNGVLASSICVVIAGSSACTRADQSGAPDSVTAQADANGTPSLIPLDSVVLGETDSVYLSLPSSFVVTGAGDMYVADVGLRQVLHFRKNGEMAGRVGRQGSGPGEYKTPTWLTLLGDSILLVKNDARLRVMAFGTDSGAFKWERVFPGLTSSMYVRGDKLYVGLIDILHRGSVGVLTAGPGLGSLVTAGDSVHIVGPLPSLFERVPKATSVFGSVEVVAFGDTVASAYEVSNHIYLTRVASGAGSAVDSVNIPIGARRGARTDLFRQITPDKNSAIQALYKSSIPFELARLSSGQLAYIVFDPTVENRRMTGKLFLSLIDLARGKSCVDALIPAQADPPARVTFRGDTLYTLSQELSSSDRARSVLRSYRIDARRCRWR